MRTNTSPFKTVVALSVVVPALLLTSCGNGEEDPANNGLESNGEEFSGVLPFFTPGQGGSAYILGGAVSNEVSEQIDGVQGTVEATTGTQEIIQQVSQYHEQGRPAMGTPDTAGAYRATVGDSPFEETYDEIRALGAIQEASLYFVARSDSNIDSLSDLSGLDVGLGVPGSGVNMVAQDVLEAHGIGEGDFNELPLGYEEVADGLANNSIDAGIIAGGEPISIMTELATQHDVSIISTEPEVMEELSETAPYVLDRQTEGGMYQGIDETTDTVGFGVVMVTHAETPDSLVQEIMELLYEDTESLVRIHGSAEYISTDTALTGVEFEFHPAAREYLEEQGVDFSIE